MKTYKYEAMNSLGQPVKGEVDAENSTEAISKVRAMGNFPTKIKEQKAGITEPVTSPSLKPKTVSLKTVSLKTKVIALIIVIFFIGCLIGAAIGVAL
jgi:type II secretory pathway component PulF